MHICICIYVYIYVYIYIYIYIYIITFFPRAGMAVASSDVPLAGAEPGPLAAAAGTTAVHLPLREYDDLMILVFSAWAVRCLRSAWFRT